MLFIMDNHLMTDRDTEIAALRDGLKAAQARHARDADQIAALIEQGRIDRQETQHNIRNILSVIRSVARRTAATAETLDTYQANLDGRLAAFSRVQAALSRNLRAGVALDSLVGDQLLAFGLRIGDQVSVDGEDLRLKPRPAGLLGLAFHELAVNSVSYGALAIGRTVSVRWSREASDIGDHVCIEWTEDGTVPGATSRKTRGFGSQVIEDAIAYELSGSTLFDLSAAGLTCRVRLPQEHFLG
jgi:two-component sensor histidine kinase